MEMKQFNAGKRYECPVYYTLERSISKNSNLITSFWLPIKDDVRPEHWIKRGAALGCHTEH